MREIKFRAWSEYSNQMIDWVAMMNEPTTCSVLNGDDEKIHIMQFTGLKDKNGREIYEGDILKCKCWDRKNNPDGFNPAHETPYFYRNSLIEWWQSHCNLGYRLRDGKGKTLMIKPSSLRAMDVEIIGNIYENPELLEAEK